jgi:hypothetical protein
MAAYRRRHLLDRLVVLFIRLDLSLKASLAGVALWLVSLPLGWM